MKIESVVLDVKTGEQKIVERIATREEIVFSEKKQAEIKKQEKIIKIKTRLEQISQDIVQSLAGAEFEDMAERQKEFQTLHNELRILLGKEPRKYLEVDNETNN